MSRRAGTHRLAVVRTRRLILALTAAGWSSREIAAEVDRSVSQVNRVRAGDLKRERDERAARRMLAGGSRIFASILRGA